MLFNRIIPIVAVVLFTAYVDSRNRKNNRLKREDDANDSSSANDATEATVVPTKKPPPPPAPPITKPQTSSDATSTQSAAVQKAINALSSEQQKAVLALFNSGTPKALQVIPGLGASMVTRIRKARPFANPADLLEVSGVGERRLIDLLGWAKENL